MVHGTCERRPRICNKHSQECGICEHGPLRAPTRRPCPPGLLHVPTEVGDCVTFLSTTNFSSTSYTTYTCCQQLFARWVCRSPEPHSPVWGRSGGAAAPDPAPLLPARCSRTGRSPSAEPGPGWRRASRAWRSAVGATTTRPAWGQPRDSRLHWGQRPGSTGVRHDPPKGGKSPVRDLCVWSSPLQ